MKITYWSDYACPYCYIGEARLKKTIAGMDGIELEMKAFQLYWNDQISGTDIYNRSAYNSRQTLLDST